MLGYAIAFILGGYLIPASMVFHGIWMAENAAEDGPTIFERAMTAFVGAVTWPATIWRFEPQDE